MRKFAVILALLMFCTMIAFSFSSAGKESEKLKETVQALGEKMIKATIAEDWETVFAMYTDDVISMPNYGKMLKGKEAVKLNTIATKEAGVKFHSMDFTPLKVWSCDDMVYEMGIYGVSLTLPGMPHPVADTGKYLTIWEKQSDGVMKVKYEIWNTDTDPMDMAKWLQKYMQEHEKEYVKEHEEVEKTEQEQQYEKREKKETEKEIEEEIEE